MFTVWLGACAGFVLGEKFSALSSGAAVAWETLGPQLLVLLMVPAVVLGCQQTPPRNSTLDISSGPRDPRHVGGLPDHTDRQALCTTLTDDGMTCSQPVSSSKGLKTTATCMPCGQALDEDVQCGSMCAGTGGGSVCASRHAMQLAALSLPHTGKMLTAMLCAAIHRHHLMIWAVFAPRLLFEACAFLPGHLIYISYMLSMQRTH